MGRAGERIVTSTSLGSPNQARLPPGCALNNAQKLTYPKRPKLSTERAMLIQTVTART